MGKIKKKLKSERGASITWALLIFLVCAVVGSAVLVAGTTAAGRMSKLAVNEQRYYSVTSAAGLLRDALKQEVTVVRTPTTAPAFEDHSVDPKATFSDAFLIGLVKRIMGWSGAASDWSKDEIVITDPPSPSASNTVSLIITNASTGNAALGSALSNVDATIEFKPDGSLVADIKKDGYEMRLSFELVRTFSSETVTSTTGDPPVTTTTEVKTDTFHWELREARTVESKDKPSTSTD